MTKKDDDLLQAREKLRQITNKIPSAFSQFDYRKTVIYKKDIQDSLRIINMKSATKNKIDYQIQIMEFYHKQ